MVCEAERKDLLKVALSKDLVIGIWKQWEIEETPHWNAAWVSTVNCIATADSLVPWRENQLEVILEAMESNSHWMVVLVAMKIDDMDQKMGWKGTGGTNRSGSVARHPEIEGVVPENVE